MTLSAVPSLLAACLVLMAGDLLAKRVPWLARFSIPAPIVGGVLFALGAMVVGRLGAGSVTFDISAKSTFLLLFFASVGLTADLAMLRRGSRRLLRFLAALFPFLVVQNALGLLMAVVLGLHPVLGLVAGSITLVGGHGTGAAYAERFAQDYGLLNVMGLTMTAATLGLVIGGIVGGPVAERLMRRYRLEGTAAAGAGDVVVGPQRTPVTTSSFIAALAAGLAAVVAGQAIAEALAGAPVTVPGFLWCLLIGLVLRNGGAALGLKLHDASAELLGSAPESAVVVPVVGAFFVDLMNLAVLTFFLLPGFIVPR